MLGVVAIRNSARNSGRGGQYLQGFCSSGTSAGAPGWAQNVQMGPTEPKACQYRSMASSLRNYISTPELTETLQDFLCIRKNYSMYNFINISEFKSLAAGENAGLTMRTDPEG
jgi:hypothetical protein